MKTLLLATLLITSVSHAATGEVTASEGKLRGCLTMVYKDAAAFKGASKDVTKLVSAGTKSCRDQVREIAKKEKAAKQYAKITAQIAKLQAKLSK